MKQVNNTLALCFKLVTQNVINQNNQWVEMRNQKRYLKTLSRFVENVTVYILRVEKQILNQYTFHKSS